MTKSQITNHLQLEKEYHNSCNQIKDLMCIILRDIFGGALIWVSFDPDGNSIDDCDTPLLNEKFVIFYVVINPSDFGTKYNKKHKTGRFGLINGDSYDFTRRIPINWLWEDNYKEQYQLAVKTYEDKNGKTT